MYRPSNISEAEWPAYKEAVAQPDRAWSLKISLDFNPDYNPKIEPGKLHQDLTENDIQASSLVFREQSTCSSDIMVGSTFANSLDFNVLNNDGQFRQFNFMKAKVSATVLLYVSSLDKWAEIKLGTFVVLDAGKKYTTIPIKCMDSMFLFNRPLEDANPAFPMKLLTLFQKVCLLIGVSYTTNLYNQIPDLTLNAFDVSKITCRDFLANLGCLIGKNLRMSRINQLEAFWYSNSDATTTPDTRMNITLNDLAVHPTAVAIKDWDGKEYAPENANTSYLLNFETNPLIQNEKSAISVLANLNALCTSVQYSTYDCQYIGDPTVQAGDTVTHNVVIEEQQVRESVESLVMVHEYKFRGTGRLSAVGRAAEQDRQLTADAKKILDVQIQAAKDLNNGLSYSQQTLLNQSKLFGESMALYCGTKFDAQGRLLGYYMASENIFLGENGVIAPDDSNVDKRTDCYVWAYGIDNGVSSDGYSGKYYGITRDGSIIAKIITADWIRTGVLSAKDDSLQIDMDSGKLSLRAKLIKKDKNGIPMKDENSNYIVEDGCGQTVLDGIGALFTYWNKNVISADDDGHPKMAYLNISADADENESDDTRIAADLKIIWSTYDGKMNTSVGHTIYHAADGSKVDEIQGFEIKSNAPIHVAPSLYYDEALLFDNLIMRRTNTVPGNTGVDFLIAPKSIPIVPIPNGQINLLTNPGFENKTLNPWVLYGGTWPITSTSAYVHSGIYAAQCPGSSSNTLYLPKSVITQIGLYQHPVYIGFWLKALGNNQSGTYPIYLRSGATAGTASTVHIQVVSDGSKWMYASAIIPALQSNWVLSLYSSSSYGYSVDDFNVYDAQGYSQDQWDDYVMRREK